MNTNQEILDLSCLFEKPVAFHRCFAEITGSAAGGLFLSQLVYWDRVVRKSNPNRDGWIHKIQAEWTEETALKRTEQESARRKLRKLNILEEVRKGAPPKLWFRLNRNELNKRLAQLISPPPTEKPKNQPVAPVESQNAESCILDGRNLHSDQKRAVAPVESQNAESCILESRNLHFKMQDSAFLHTENTNRDISSNKPEPAQENVSFDFDLVYGWIINKLERAYNLNLTDRAFIEAKLETYQSDYKKPNKGDALSYVEQALNHRLQIDLRSAKIAQARNNHADAVTNNLNAQAESLNQKAGEIAPKQAGDKFDRSWAEGVAMLDESVV